MLFNKNCCGFGGVRNNNMGMCPRQPQKCCEREVVEPTITNCVEKEFYHEVPHVCPIHTHVINKHIYTHTYRPCYSCSEENQVINNDCGGCCNFAR